MLLKILSSRLSSPRRGTANRAVLALSFSRPRCWLCWQSRSPSQRRPAPISDHLLCRRSPRAPGSHPRRLRKRKQRPSDGPLRRLQHAPVQSSLEQRRRSVSASRRQLHRDCQSRRSGQRDVPHCTNAADPRRQKIQPAWPPLARRPAYEKGAISMTDPAAAATGKLVQAALEKAGKWDAFKARVTVFKGTVSEVAADLQVGTRTPASFGTPCSSNSRL